MDRELLEMAAKAISLPECGWMGPAFMYVKDNRFTDWNPLTDDGDAMRLSVKLGLAIIQHSKIKDGRLEVAVFEGENLELEPYGSDPFAATRRAIVRAAAEMGKSIT